MTVNEVLNIILVSRKKIISGTIIGSILFFILLYIVYPVTYTSTVTILPPDNKTNSGLNGLLQSSDLSNLISPSSTNNSQLYAEILKSRTASEMVVKKFNLIEFLGKKNIIDASNKLSEMLNVEVTKEGIIKINVPVSTYLFGRITSQKEKIQLLSSYISNEFVESLDKINRTKLSSKAKKARVYIEERLTATKIQLDSTEAVLMNFQKENKAISLPEQVKASIDEASTIKSEIIKTEMSLGLLSQDLSENNSTIISLKSKLNELQNQYKKFETGSEDFFIAFKDAPEVGLKLADLVRDVKILNEVYLMLQQQYYKELIQENKDVPTVEVLDAAIVPTRESSPRLLFSTALACILIFLLMSLIAIISQKKDLFL